MTMTEPAICIGCGAKVAKPSKKEKAMMRKGRRTYCDECLGGRSRKMAKELLERFDTLIAELEDSPEPLRALRDRLQTGVDGGSLVPELEKRAKACIAVLDELHEASTFAKGGPRKRESTTPPAEERDSA